MAKMNLLGDAAIRNAKPEVRAACGSRGEPLKSPTAEQLEIKPRLKKLNDGGGLSLWVMPDGGKRWRFSYRFDGKQKSLAIGTYPDVGLGEARREARGRAKDVA